MLTGQGSLPLLRYLAVILFQSMCMCAEGSFVVENQEWDVLQRGVEAAMRCGFDRQSAIRCSSAVLLHNWPCVTALRSIQSLPLSEWHPNTPTALSLSQSRETFHYSWACLFSFWWICTDLWNCWLHSFKLWPVSLFSRPMSIKCFWMRGSLFGSGHLFPIIHFVWTSIPWVWSVLM